MDADLSDRSFGDFFVDNRVWKSLFEDTIMESDEDEFLADALTQIEQYEIETIQMPATPTVNNSVMTEPEPKPQRFTNLADEEIDQLVDSRQSKSTKKQTDWSVRQFKLWLTERNLPSEFEMLSTQELDEILRRFFAEVRTTEGKMYSRSTYNGIRAAINRHISSPPFNRTISLTDKDFHKSNAVYKATLKKLSMDGHDTTTHHEPISDGDLKKLREADFYHRLEPRSLQKKVWFELTLAFPHRGCENIQNLKKDAYIFKRDDTGREYVEVRYNEKLKNHQGEERTVNRESRSRMYASKQNSDNCPVKAFKLYLS